MAEDERAQPEVRNLEELLDLAQEAGRIGLFEWDVAANVVQLSARFLTIYGLDSFDGHYEAWIACIHREDQLRIRTLLSNAFVEKQRGWTADFRIVNPHDQQLKWIEARNVISYSDDGRPLRVVGVTVDITERKRAAAEQRVFTDALEDAVKERTRELVAENEARKKAEELLRQAQKMEAVGQLTGGIAHDFNNLLTIVMGGLDMIARHIQSLPPSPAIAHIVRAKDMAREGARRAATLTSRLLAFSRQQPLSPETIDVNKLVAGVCELLHRTLGESVTCETVLAAGLWRTEADPNQLESALVNLAVNARDAMPGGGKLTVETANCYLGAAYVAATSELVEEGQYVMIAVADTGMGMPPDTLARAFDPFFTTKEVGKGTGLGLSQVYGFVRQSGGHVKIYSEVGQGTTVKIYLRRSVAKDASQIDEVSGNENVRAIGRETILVVEDDDTLRGYSVEVLRELGYTVMEAADGENALAALDRSKVDLLFTDVVMPGGMSGRLLADEAARRRPELKILFTTGYTRNAIVHQGRLDSDVELIGKPFSFEDLAVKVRKILDRP